MDKNAFFIVNKTKNRVKLEKNEKPLPITKQYSIFAKQFQSQLSNGRYKHHINRNRGKIEEVDWCENQLADENKRLEAENEALKNENLALVKANMELQDKLNKSTIVNALGNEEEIEEGRKLIKSLVREIDQCVSILNSKE